MYTLFIFFIDLRMFCSTCGLNYHNKSYVLKNSMTTILVTCNSWEDNYLCVSELCVLHELKKRLIDQLIEQNILESDTDNESQIEIGRNKNKNKNEFRGMQVNINDSTMLIHCNCVKLKLKKDFYITLIKKKNIGRHADKIYEIIDKLILQLDAEENESDESGLTKREQRKIASLIVKSLYKFIES